MSQALTVKTRMSLTQAYAQLAQEVSVNPLTEAEYNELYNLLQTLIDHINSNGNEFGFGAFRWFRKVSQTFNPAFNGIGQ